MLALIFFSLIFGAALTMIPRKTAQPVIDVLQGIGDAIIKIIDMAMKLAPYGVFGLIFVITSQFGWGILGQLSMYVIVVLLGLFILAGILWQLGWIGGTGRRTEAVTSRPRTAKNVSLVFTSLLVLVGLTGPWMLRIF